MYHLPVFRRKASKLCVLVCLVLDPILLSSIESATCAILSVQGRLTAPYLEICRTKSEASLNSGRGTILLPVKLPNDVLKLPQKRETLRMLRDQPSSNSLDGTLGLGRAVAPNKRELRG